VERELKSMIKQASEDGSLYSTDWNEVPLPRYRLNLNFAIFDLNRIANSRWVNSGCTSKINPKSTKSKSFNSPKVKNAGIFGVKETAAELSKRESRQLRFQSSPKASTPISRPKSVKRFTGHSDGDDESNAGVIVGTSTTLEKPYLRLTSVSAGARTTVESFT
jgi:hypothetical protein